MGAAAPQPRRSRHRHGIDGRELETERSRVTAPAPYPTTPLTGLSVPEGCDRGGDDGGVEGIDAFAGVQDDAGEEAVAEFVA